VDSTAERSERLMQREYHGFDPKFDKGTFLLDMDANAPATIVSKRKENVNEVLCLKLQ